MKNAKEHIGRHGNLVVWLDGRVESGAGQGVNGVDWHWWARSTLGRSVKAGSRDEAFKCARDAANNT